MARRGEPDIDEQAPQPTLLDRMEGFERFRGNGAPVRNSHALTSDLDVEPILPDAWRTESNRRRQPRRRRRRAARPWARKARWWVLLLLVLGGAAAAAVLVFIPRYAEDLADDRAVEYRDGLAEVDAAIPEMLTALDDLGSIDLAGEELANRMGPFGRFRSATTSLSDIARRPLPEVPPLFPADAVDELAPVRERVTLVAGRSDVLAGRIGRFVAYRTALDDAFVLPELPTAVPPTEVNDLSLALAQMLADSLEAVSRLPSDPFLDAHRSSVQETLDWFRSWEIDYLEELRKGNPSAASALVNQARARLGRLRIQLELPLLEFADWARGELAGLERDVAEALVVVPQPE